MTRHTCNSWLTAWGIAVIAGCGGGNAANPDAASHDADFTVCAGYDAGPYMSGYVTASEGGGYSVTLVSVMKESVPPVTTLAVGLNTFTVKVSDAGGAAATGISLTAEKPFMPKHNHGAATYPTVTDEGGGTFVLSQINFFMPGYWELTLNLLPANDAGPALDKVVLALCVPS